MLGLVWACWMHVPRGFFGIQCRSLWSRFPVIIPDAPVQLLGRDGACPLWVWPSQNLILNPVGSYSLDLGDGPAFLGLGNIPLDSNIPLDFPQWNKGVRWETSLDVSFVGNKQIPLK